MRTSGAVQTNRQFLGQVFWAHSRLLLISRQFPGRDPGWCDHFEVLARRYWASTIQVFEVSVINVLPMLVLFDKIGLDIERFALQLLLAAIANLAHRFIILLLSFRRFVDIRYLLDCRVFRAGRLHLLLRHL